MSLIGGVVRVALVGVVIQVGPGTSSCVLATTTARHDDQIVTARVIVL